MPNSSNDAPIDKNETEMNEQFSDLAESIGEAAAQWQQSWGDWVQNLKDAPANSDSPAAEMAALSETAANMKMDPAKVMEIQAGLLKDFQALWMNTTARLMGQEAEPVITPARDDYRFKDADWDENPVFDFIKQSYLLNSRWIQQTLENIEGLDGEAVRKLNFVSRQLIDAMAPSNYAMTNPQVLREIADTKGESLVRGFKNLADDMKEGRDILRPTHTSMDNFEVGVDLATTPGSVVYQTPIMQLIQYAPTTEKVYKKPLLIVPPWINKFYILDLKPENSFIKWAVEKGYTVFVVSWANPDESFKDKSFDDYVEEGIFAALDGVEQATGERQVSAIGYCIGGTLLAAILARMAAENDDRITAATFFAAQVDFEDAGDLKVFTSEDGINKLEAEIGDKGYLDATSMAATFNMLRPNDLIWFFVINNYLMGKEPPVFDLLYWNGDATCFPAKLLLDYLRGMYQRNDLAEGRFTLLGKPANLGDIKIPTYIQASREDHIAPANSVIKMTRLFGGENTFMLAGSGHIAGVINPPDKKKYQYWTNTSGKNYETVEAWLEDATETPGSWWGDWHKWLSRKSGAKVAARTPGEGKAKVIEAAPGSYVRVRR